MWTVTWKCCVHHALTEHFAITGLDPCFLKSSWMKLNKMLKNIPQSSWHHTVVAAFSDGHLWWHIPDVFYLWRSSQYSGLIDIFETNFRWFELWHNPLDTVVINRWTNGKEQMDWFLHRTFLLYPSTEALKFGNTHIDYNCAFKQCSVVLPTSHILTTYSYSATHFEHCICFTSTVNLQFPVNIPEQKWKAEVATVRTFCT